MIRYLGEFSFTVDGCTSDDQFEDHIDRVLAELYKDDRISDPDYTARTVGRWVEFSLSAPAADEREAFVFLHSALRAAIHAADGATPGWEQCFNQVQSSVRSDPLAHA